MENFEKFLTELKAELKSVQNAKGPSGIKNLERLLNQVEDMVSNEHLKFIVDNQEKLGILSVDIKGEIQKILTDFHLGRRRENEMLNTLKMRTGGFFPMTKGYQLSHVNGFIKDEVWRLSSIKEEFKNYLIFLRYLDYYESLLALLVPFLRFKSGLNWKGIKAEKIISFIGEKYPNSNLIKFYDKPFKDLRNYMGHAYIVFDGQSVFHWNKNTQCLELEKERIVLNIQMMINLFVVTATEIDLFILRLGLGKKDDFAPEWMEYFENYVRWFSKIGTANE